MPSPRVCFRLDKVLNERIRKVVESRAGKHDFPADYSLTDFVVTAIRDKLDHIDRSRKAKRKGRQTAAIADV